MIRHLVLMRFALMICFSFALIAVMMCVYKVTVSVTRPLKGLIKFANIINNNATEKNFLADTEREIDNLPEVVIFYIYLYKRTQFFKKY